MARGGVNKALVLAARTALLARGDHPSIDALRIEMGNTGSKTTIHRYLKELEDADDRGGMPSIEIGDELSELVSRLAQRLQEQAQEQIDQARRQLDEQREICQQHVIATELQLSTLHTRFTAVCADLEAKNSALESTRANLHTEQTAVARLLQAQQDLTLRLDDKDRQIGSLEEKHLHAREALEHYRSSVKEQREQEQRRHEGQLQQVQMELRQAQQSAMVRQEEITQLNRDNERLLAEARTALRESSAQQQQLSTALSEKAALNDQCQRVHANGLVLQERLNVALGDSQLLKQTLSEQQQTHQRLHVELIKAEVELENLHASLAALNGPEDIDTPKI